MYSLETYFSWELREDGGYSDLEVDVLDHNQKVQKYEGKIMPRATIETLIKARDELETRLKAARIVVAEKNNELPREAESAFSGGAAW